MKQYPNEKLSEFPEKGIESFQCEEIKISKIKKKLENILNMRVVLALTYLKDYYLCKILLDLILIKLDSLILFKPENQVIKNRQKFKKIKKLF